jgi:hypothetical protein
VTEQEQPAPLHYAAPTKSEGWPPPVIFAVGLALSWGPVGIVVAYVVGQIWGSLDRGGPVPGLPYPDSGISAFVRALLTYPIAGVLGTAVSFLVARRAGRRQFRNYLGNDPTLR